MNVSANARISCSSPAFTVLKESVDRVELNEQDKSEGLDMTGTSTGRSRGAFASVLAITTLGFAPTAFSCNDEILADLELVTANWSEIPASPDASEFTDQLFAQYDGLNNEPGQPFAFRLRGVDYVAEPAPGQADRDLHSHVRPFVSFPQRASSQGLSGVCSVKFNVSISGEVYGAEAACTNRIFVREAEQAVSRSRYLPRIVNEHVVSSHDQILRLDFCMR